MVIGKDVNLFREFIEKSDVIQGAMANNRNYLQTRTFVGNSPSTKSVMQKVANSIPNTNGKVKYKIEDFWDTDNGYTDYNIISENNRDTILSLGSFKLRSTFKGTVERYGNEIIINGTFYHLIEDTYDFNNMLFAASYIAQKLKCAKPFQVKGSFQEEVIGRALVDSEGNITDTYIRTYEKEK